MQRCVLRVVQPTDGVTAPLRLCFVCCSSTNMKRMRPLRRGQHLIESNSFAAPRYTWRCGAA